MSKGDLVEWEVYVGPQDEVATVTGTVETIGEDGYAEVRRLIFNEDGSCSIGTTTVAVSRCRVLQRAEQGRTA